MTEPVAKWIMLRYATLWKLFFAKPFTYHQAKKGLKNDSMISIALSELRRSGWLKIELDPKDARKRIYTLVDPLQAIEKMVESSQ